MVDYATAGEADDSHDAKEEIWMIGFCWSWDGYGSRGIENETGGGWPMTTYGWIC